MIECSVEWLQGDGVLCGVVAVWWSVVTVFGVRHMSRVPSVSQPSK